VNPAAKLAAFAVVLALAFGGGAALGAAVGPDDSAPLAPAHDGHETTSTTPTTIADDTHEGGAR